MTKTTKIRKKNVFFTFFPQDKRWEKVILLADLPLFWHKVRWEYMDEFPNSKIRYLKWFMGTYYTKNLVKNRFNKK